MEKYVATPDAEIIGVAMHNFFVSIHAEQFEHIVKDVLSDAGIDSFKEDEWYSFQLALDVFHAIETQTNNQNLVALGMAYVETALFPPEVNGIESGLILLADTYHLNSRNTLKDEGYVTTVIDPTHIRVKDYNPFPHDVVYGFIWGICRRFKEQGEQFSVYREYVNQVDPNSAGAIYNIRIER